MPNNPNNKKEPEDIFAGIGEGGSVDKSKQSSYQKKKSAQSKVNSRKKIGQKIKKKTKEKFFSFKLSKIDWTYIGIFLLIGLVIDGIIIFYSIQRLNFQSDIKVNISHEKISQEVSSPEQEEAQEKMIDSDGDGLSDTRENSLGTYILEPDSDQDGLFDKEEVDIYSTNALEKDTDKDGKTDGEEVEQGLDPNNPDPKARLLDINSEINK